MFYGIDFGTTKTSVVKLEAEGESKRLIHLDGGKSYPFPSLAAVQKKGGKMLFGDEVKANRNKLSEEYYIIHSLKSFINQNKDIIADGEKISVAEVLANFLLYIKEFLKADKNEDITEATFALPQDFTPEGRKILKKAADAAGIKVRGFINEPTAAYIANMNYIKKYSNVMVLDWGGGTADISILNIHEGKIYELSVFGEALGGDDIDYRLAEYLHPRLTENFPIDIAFSDINNEALDRILNACEQLKIDFSSYEDGEEEITLADYCGIDSTFAEVSSSEFDEITAPIVKQIVGIIKKALEMSKMELEAIDRVILSGGSCEIRAFRNIINEIFTPEKVLLSENMQWAVAEGAAIIASLGGNIYLNDDICVVLSDNSTYPILEKGESYVGAKTGELCFALTEDSKSANFIFTNSDKSISYGARAVNTKGFLREELILSASLDTDQIAKIEIKNKSMGKDYAARLDINKLKFYYDMKSKA